MQEIKINTEALQDMVGRVICCSSNNKLIPLTSLMSIKVHNNVLTLTTTDATNYFYVNSKDKVDCEDFEVSVIAELFTRLIQKTTTKEVTLTINNNVLEVKGNGTYKIELPLDENGNAIKFPNKLPDEEPVFDTVIMKSVIDKIINYNKPSLAISVERPVLCSYYCGGVVLSGDREKICCTDIDLLGKKLLITAPLMDLLGVMSEESINVKYADDHTLFWTPTDTIYAPITSGVDAYPADALKGLLDLEIKSMCKVSHTAVMDMLDRLSLFVSSYDKKEITLTFAQDGVLFSSKQSSGTELVPYTESVNFEPFTCGIDIEMFKSQISAQDCESITMYYGHPDFIKMVSGNVTQLVALADDGEEA